MEKILEVRNLNVTLPVPAGDLHAVRGVNLDVARNETLCIVGESGSGKSVSAFSFMRLLPKAARIDAERLLFKGQDLLNMTNRELLSLRGNRMSMIFQEPMSALNPTYTIGDQLTEVMRYHGKASRRECVDRAVYMLERVGITAAASRLNQYPHQLSGGLRQRVVIAMALMCNPDLIIADEPTTALDVTIQTQILRLLKELQAEFGMAIILITHDLGVVGRMADRVAVMYAGELVEVGSAEAIFGKPSHPYTQGLLGCTPVPGATPRGSRLGSIPGVVPSLVGKQTGCGFLNRCTHASDACTSSIPLRQHTRGHVARCVLNDLPERETRNLELTT